MSDVPPAVSFKRQKPYPRELEGFIVLTLELLALVLEGWWMGKGLETSKE